MVLGGNVPDKFIEHALLGKAAEDSNDNNRSSEAKAGANASISTDSPETAEQSKDPSTEPELSETKSKAA